MKLGKLQKHWQDLALQDPLWAVLSWPDKQNNRWEAEEFLETGRSEIKSAMEYLKRLEVSFGHDSALDFGCGAGRLTQALADHFEHAAGVDIAPGMIARAKKLNQKQNCSFALNTTADLAMFPSNSFSFIYSRLTFQHMRPEYTKLYLSEFMRVLEPGGVALFVQPAKRPISYDAIREAGVKEAIKMLIPSSLQNLIRNAIGELKRKPVMELHGIDKNTMIKWLDVHNSQLVNIDEFGKLGADWICYRYCIKKPHLEEK